MGHIKPELIADLATELAAIRTLPHLKEKKLGVFYLKSTPFLHFHDKDGLRWAHVKTADGEWEKVEVSFGASTSARNSFLKAIKAVHATITSKGAKP